MSWAIGYDTTWKRWIGYGVVAYCDHPDCNEEIDRGLSHVCGREPYGGEQGCGLYFCSLHTQGEHQLCERCFLFNNPFPAKAEHPTWIKHLLTDESWQLWRDENENEVAALRSKMNVYQHLGDLGDIIAALPVMRQLGHGQLILGDIDGRGTDREHMDAARFAAIAPLIERQPYIFGVSNEHDAKGVTHSFYKFRETPCRIGEEAHNLVNWQGDFFGLSDVDVSPWLEGIQPSLETRGKAVFARTLRYHGTNFHWAEIAQSRFPNAIFVGFEDEHRAFCGAAGKEVPWRPTANLLEVAELIAGSDMLVSNQCVASWIAMGMGHPLIQEVCNWSVNSIIRRDNAEFRY